MDFRDTPEEAHFRTELREWIAQHAPRKTIPTDADAQAAFFNAWHRELYRAGYIGLSFPEDCGGHGKPEIYDAILNDELGAAEAPPGPAIAHIANAIRIFGSDEQRRRHLPGLLSGEVRWCQGFSEPGAGSDLASLSTRAEIEEDGAYRVNGQKIWTSEAVWSDWCMLLAREPGTQRQKGISVLLVPLDRQGVDTREIITASGSREFAEVFFDDARVEAENLLGEPGQGWEIAMALLAYERGPADMGWVARLESTLKRLEGLLGQDPNADPGLRMELAGAYVDLRALQTRVQCSLSQRLDGSRPGSEGSIDKLLMTRVDQRIHRLMMDVLGAPPLIEEGRELDLYFWSRAQSIFGGTQQIQRDIVAQRVLGLPRAPRTRLASKTGQ
ncbi:MAG: acyl-CoA dehydrogenase family protein [Deltaproteobacteria bacterium]|jgi:alkylation response protein AidB-like acyl-CoA dehydrogenase|nr:acyl-CoA dehydrogenase family protein [Deltaproteobacteria bacterium]